VSDNAGEQRPITLGRPGKVIGLFPCVL